MNAPFVVLIPARYGATRLPGKPLLAIDGKPLIHHVIERAKGSAATEIILATDDPRIADACSGLGIDIALTQVSHPSGTDRIAEVVAGRNWPDDTLLVNLQGDEPCMPPVLIDQVARDLAEHGEHGMATLAFPIETPETLLDPHVVKVVTDGSGDALYFSRAPIPWHRDGFPTQGPLPEGTWLRHIGLYAYRAGFLRRFVTWEPAPLERLESLEQLRVLWHGERIHVSRARVPPGPGVDTEADHRRALAYLREHGEGFDRRM